MMYNIPGSQTNDSLCFSRMIFICILYFIQLDECIHSIQYRKQLIKITLSVHGVREQPVQCHLKDSRIGPPKTKTDKK